MTEKESEDAFLTFLSLDFEKYCPGLTEINSSLLTKIENLIKDVEFDLSKPLEDE